MASVFHIVLPMFVLIGLGFYAARWRGFSGLVAHGLSSYLGLYALPGLLFFSMAKAQIPRPIEWGFLASFFLSAFVVFGFGTLLMWGLRKRDEAVQAGLASSFSNIALIGLPIIVEAYGDSVAVPVMLLIIFQSPLMFTLATTLAEARRARGGRVLQTAAKAIRATLLNPLVAAVLTGFVVNWSGCGLPDVVGRSLELLSRTVLPCACFSLGATLAFTKGASAVWPATMTMLFKNVLHPLITWALATWVFKLPPQWIAPAVTAAALPIGVNVYVFAERYQSGRELVSMSLLLSTLFSPISIAGAFMLSAH